MGLPNFLGIAGAVRPMVISLIRYTGIDYKAQLSIINRRGLYVKFGTVARWNN